jgi:hypothetical protein
MYVASVRMSAVATVVVEDWERPSFGDQMIVVCMCVYVCVCVCVVEGVQNARAMRLHHSAV